MKRTLSRVPRNTNRNPEKQFSILVTFQCVQACTSNECQNYGHVRKKIKRVPDTKRSYKAFPAATTISLVGFPTIFPRTQSYGGQYRAAHSPTSTVVVVVAVCRIFGPRRTRKVYRFNQISRPTPDTFCAQTACTIFDIMCHYTSNDIRTGWDYEIIFITIRNVNVLRFFDNLLVTSIISRSTLFRIEYRSRYFSNRHPNSFLKTFLRVILADTYVTDG